LVFGLLAAGSSLPAQELQPEEARGGLIQLRLPITDDVDLRFKHALERLLTKFPAGESRPVLLIEFVNSQGNDGRGSDFSRAQALAERLVKPDFARVKTVAFIPAGVKVRGHAVLVALACEEIIMAPDAELGEAGIDEQGGNDKTRRTAYSVIAEARRKPVALALGMLDGSLQVYRVETATGTEYVLEEELPALRQKKNVTKETPLDRRPGLYTGRQFKTELGLVNYLAKDRGELAAALKLPEKLVQDDFALTGDAKAIQVRIDGAVTPALLGEIDNKVRNAVIKDGVNFVLVTINSPGGNPNASKNLALSLAGLRGTDEQPVRTVAWIEKQALADAAWIALGCDDIVMGTKARIGGVGNSDPDLADRQGYIQHYKDTKDPLKPVMDRGTAHAKNHPSWSLGAAIVGHEESAARYRNKVSNISKVFTEEELGQQADPAAWEKQEGISVPNQSLELSGQEALKLGLARQTVENLAQLKELYGLEDNPALVDPGWVDFLLRGLRNEYVMIFLLLIGGAGVFAELQTPGIGLGGFIAFVCFLLYFWGQFLEGTAGWLEVLLFVSGLIFVLMELFLFPGFGIFGFGGGLLIIVSLVLASQTAVIPTNSYQLGQLRNTLLIIAGAGVGVIAAGVGLRRILPSTPGLNRMFLEPPTVQEREELSRSESLVDYQHLLGKLGKTTTKLTPAGKALIGEQLVDVVAPGDYLDPGTPIEVVDVRGYRVIVRAVE